MEILYKMRVFTFIRNGGFLIALLILSSCHSIKIGGPKSKSKSFETFFVGEEGTQYFIKPLKFSLSSNENLELDITFRHKTEIKDSAIVNISFIGSENFKNIDSLRINNEEISILINEVNLLFTERKADLFNCRFSSKVSLFELKSLFESSNWEINAFREGKSGNYKTPKTTKKKLDNLNYQIFELF